MSRTGQPFTSARTAPMPGLVLTSMALTGIYLVHGIPRDLQRAARARAARQGTTLRRVLLEALREYAAESWTPGGRPGPGVSGAG